jgi:diadenosine tetraphosphate (Ap4A) HIT family hydrolase
LAPERILRRGELCVAFADGYPVSAGHTLVIPKRHVASFFETTVEERSEFLSAGVVPWRTHRAP